MKHSRKVAIEPAPALFNRIVYLSPEARSAFNRDHKSQTEREALKAIVCGDFVTGEDGRIAPSKAYYAMKMPHATKRAPYIDHWHYRDLSRTEEDLIKHGLMQPPAPRPVVVPWS